MKCQWLFFFSMTKIVQSVMARETDLVTAIAGLSKCPLTGPGYHASCYTSSTLKQENIFPPDWSNASPHHHSVQFNQTHNTVCLQCRFHKTKVMDNGDHSCRVSYGPTFPFLNWETAERHCTNWKGFLTKYRCVMTESHKNVCHVLFLLENLFWIPKHQFIKLSYSS